MSKVAEFFRKERGHLFQTQNSPISSTAPPVVITSPASGSRMKIIPTTRGSSVIAPSAPSSPAPVPSSAPTISSSSKIPRASRIRIARGWRIPFRWSGSTNGQNRLELNTLIWICWTKLLTWWNGNLKTLTDQLREILVSALWLGIEFTKNLGSMMHFQKK